MRLVVALVGLACLQSARCDDEWAAECRGMKTKALRIFLRERGLQCEGCTEKSDFVEMCIAHKDTPLVEIKPAEPEKKENIEDILGSLKGMPGMEGIKMFTADDLKNMGPDGMGSAFGGRDPPPRKSREEWYSTVEEFYTRYGLTDKLDGINTVLDKWTGREEKMMRALNKKYKDHIEAQKEEL